MAFRSEETMTDYEKDTAALGGLSSTDLGEIQSLVQDLAILCELPHDLFAGTLPLFPTGFLAPFRSIGTLVGSGSFQRPSAPAATSSAGNYLGPRSG